MILGGNQYPPKQHDNSEPAYRLRTVDTAQLELILSGMCREPNNAYASVPALQPTGEASHPLCCIKFWEGIPLSLNPSLSLSISLSLSLTHTGLKIQTHA